MLRLIIKEVNIKEDAIKDYTKAIELDPKFAMAYY